YVAVAIDMIVALASLGLSRITAYSPTDRDSRIGRSMRNGDEPTKPFISPEALPVYITIALSGATALAAEAVWTRMLSLLLGATTYTFSLILAAFLVGLGIGSSVGSMVGKSSKNPRFALGICQLMLTAAIAWAAYSMSNYLP